MCTKGLDFQGGHGCQCNYPHKATRGRGLRVCRGKQCSAFPYWMAAWQLLQDLDNLQHTSHGYCMMKCRMGRTCRLTWMFYRKMFIGGLNWETTDGKKLQTHGMSVWMNVC